MSETTEHWDMVAACVDAYAAMLISGQTPPGFESILPDEPKAVRSLAIVELAKLQMERLADLGQRSGWLSISRSIPNCGAVLVVFPSIF